VRQFNLVEFTELVLSHISSQKHATDRVKPGQIIYFNNLIFTLEIHEFLKINSLRSLLSSGNLSSALKIEEIRFFEMSVNLYQT
jgi:hypothetical protein